MSRMPDIPFTISLKAARVNANMSQQEVVKKTGFNKSTLINWESNKTYPPADKLCTLCHLYDVPMDCISLTKKSTLSGASS